MIYYKKYKGTNTRTGTANKWYARPAYLKTVSLDELAEHMSNHNTPYSAGAIKGMLTDMVTCIKELLLEGKQVKIPDLAIFGFGIKCVGAETREKFTVAGNIAGVHLKARATGRLRPANMKDAIVMKEYGLYDGGSGSSSSTTNP